MSQIEQSIDVDVPVRTAYNQWTQFEEFPQFMEGVERIDQTDDTHLHWVAEVAGRRHEWDAEITYQDPDNHIAWRSIDGKTNSGSVRFEPLGEGRTRIKVRIQYEPEGLESVGSALGVDDRGVRADLERFKQLVESRGSETGAWRGEVEQNKVT